MARQTVDPSISVVDLVEGLENVNPPILISTVQTYKPFLTDLMSLYKASKNHYEKIALGFTVWGIGRLRKALSLKV